MNTPSATPSENSETLPVGFKIDGDPLPTDVTIAYEQTESGITAQYSTVHKTTPPRRTLGEGGALLAASGTATGKTQEEARQKVINALAAAMLG
ncbi:MAG: hypothetical protein PHX93_02295 [Candidatus Peribacteraceae bacterium]|jgi:hypothetical protein|nr:hypothetical protein [Candidatus Peribacteraceae bacterium]